MKNLKSVLGVFCLLGSMFSGSALANTGEIYGYGSRASGLGNTMMGGTRGGFATYYNPAANSTHEGFNAEIGVAFAHPEFKEIKGITISNNAISSSSGDQVGDADTDSYLDHLGQALGVSLNFGEKMKNLSLGIAGFLPIARVAYLDTGQPFLPEYYSYRARTQRPQIYGALSVKPFSFLSFATGVAITTNLSSKVELVASTAENSASYSRFSGTVKPGAAPYFGLYLTPEEGNMIPKNFEAGLTVRLPAKSEVTIDTDARTRLLGPTNEVPIIFHSTSTVFYDPLEIDLGFAFQLLKKTWVTVEADWINYKKFKSPALTFEGRTLQLKSSVDTTPEMRDIIVPKIGFEQELGTVTARLGYAYRRSPVKNNSGAGNMVDPSKHLITAGAGVNLKDFDLTKKDLMLDLHVQYHHLVNQQITKSAGNELGTAGQTKVGSPAYDIGGKIYGGGLSLSMAL